MQWDGKQMAALAAAADSGSFEQAAAQLRITPSGCVRSAFARWKRPPARFAHPLAPLPPDRARPALVALFGAR